jgi:hypothetical protein
MYLNDQDFENSKSIYDDDHNKTLDHTTFYDDRGRQWKALSKGFSLNGLMCLVAPSGAIVYKTREQINDGQFTARHN